MTREDLFLAIGEVEEDRLARCENAVPSMTIHLEGNAMENNTMKRPKGRTLRNLLVAVVAIAMLASLTFALAGVNGEADTAITYEPFQAGIFGSEEEFLNAVFGLTGYDHVENYPVCTCGDVVEEHHPEHTVEYYYSLDRVALDPEVAQELARYVTHVGQSMTWNGFTLTVDSMLYDKLTGIGIVSYTMERPEGGLQDFVVRPNGNYSNYYFGSFGGSNLYVADKSSDTKVTGIGVFGVDEGDAHELRFTFQVRAGMTYEEVLEITRSLSWIADAADGSSELSRWTDSFEKCPETIQIRGGSPAALEVLTIEDGDVKIELTAISMRYSGVDSYDEKDHTVTVRFKDGTEYVVDVYQAYRDDADQYMTQNYLAKVVNMHFEHTRYMFNRLVDLDDVASVVLDGVEYFVD